MNMLGRKDASNSQNRSHASLLIHSLLLEPLSLSPHNYHHSTPTFKFKLKLTSIQLIIHITLTNFLNTNRERGRRRRRRTHLKSGNGNAAKIQVIDDAVQCSSEPDAKPEDKPACSTPAAQNHPSGAALPEPIASPARLAASARTLNGEEGETLTEGPLCVFAAQRAGGGKTGRGAWVWFRWHWEYGPSGVGSLEGRTWAAQPGLDGFPLQVVAEKESLAPSAPHYSGIIII